MLQQPPQQQSTHELQQEYEAAAARFQEIVTQFGPQSPEAASEAEELRARLEAYLATFA